MRLAVVAVMLAAVAGSAQATPPATLRDVAAWGQRNLTGVEDWPVLGFNRLGVTFGSPSGATLSDDGLIEGDIRQEYFEPIELDGYVMRSATARWKVDCARQRYAVLQITLYARNDLRQQLSERETEPPVWSARDLISEHAIDAMCQAAGKSSRAVKPR